MKPLQEDARYSNYDDIPLFLDANEIVKVLGLSRSSVYEMLRADTFPVIIIGGRKLVRKEKLFDWLDEQEIVTPENPKIIKSTSSTF